nr:hypothetical protein [Lachnospiraceae bacterium]
TLMGNLGFMAAAYAEIGAWLGALLINGYALYRELTPLIYPEKAIKRRTIMAGFKFYKKSAANS